MRSAHLRPKLTNLLAERRGMLRVPIICLPRFNQYHELCWILNNYQIVIYHSSLGQWCDISKRSAETSKRALSVDNKAWPSVINTAKQICEYILRAIYLNVQTNLSFLTVNALLNGDRLNCSQTTTVLILLSNSTCIRRFCMSSVFILPVLQFPLALGKGLSSL